MPVIEGEKTQIRDHTFHAYRQHQRAYRKGDFKLIEYVKAPDHHWKRGDLVAGSRVTQLFNVTQDPWETFDLAPFPKYEQKVKELQAEMKQKAQELGDEADGNRTKFDFWEFY